MSRAILPARSRLVDDSSDDFVVEPPADAESPPAPSPAAALNNHGNISKNSLPSMTEAGKGVRAPVAATTSRAAPPVIIATIATASDDCIVIERPDESEDMVLAEEAPDEPPAQEVVIESLDDAFAEMVCGLEKGERVCVVVDAANVGWAHGNGVCFSPTGVSVAIDHIKSLSQLGDMVDIMAFLPASYMRKRPSKHSNVTGNALMITDEWEALDDLVGTGHLTLVPAGDHDDVYLLTYARLHNGYVVSNDFFADHMRGVSNPTVKKSFQLWLESRRASYAFPKPSEFMLNPDCELSAVLTGHWPTPDQSEDGVCENDTVTQCRCGINIEELDSHLASSFNSGYTKEQLNIVHSHLNAVYYCLNNEIVDKITVSRKILHCLLSQDPNCSPATEMLDHVSKL